MNNEKATKDIKILIVDDEKDFLDAISVYLQKKGYSVQTAENGYKAIDIIKENKPDLVLLDVVMPDFDGIDTLKEIRRITPDLGVIMITAHTSNKRIVEAEEYGAAGFFRKSSDFLHISKMIETFIKKLSNT